MNIFKEKGEVRLIYVLILLLVQLLSFIDLILDILIYP